ncbi:hypothetical protein [Methanimicrococcus blatticola]|uniref:Tetratricopeptide repeat protein n=1 Tax=Methanimicrococcus blatticola TaxID=91560 RepID=A0A484F303_9EURY|nr:hypothetical protein [Methanimicrococcus blatticola]MBZ3936031.1 hypothetical protein [Methanimicrococcus blatticola]MCC2509357.1 hypothetical protein [Methanimicrococcus blatticola]TDQ68240.1 hypothetical protein C7391_1178 [Methanimicrococcus blatticola]
MLGDNKPMPGNAGSLADIFETGMTLMQNGADADAFLLFSKLAADENNIAVQYNLALCHYFAGENQSAFEKAEKAFSVIKKKAPVPKNPLTAQNTFTVLSQSEAGQTDYLKPMPQKLPELLPDAAKRNILRLLIDICAALRNWDAVMNYAGSLQPFEKNYENVKKAVDEAQENKGIKA